jgi:hypothetical protein
VYPPTEARRADAKAERVLVVLDAQVIDRQL